MLIFDNVRAAFGRQEILRGVSFRLEPGSLTALIGKNGCGKSTLIGCLNGQIPYQGSILYRGNDLRAMKQRMRAREIAVLPQFLTGAPLRVEELVAMGRSPYLDLGKRLTETDRRHIEQAIEATGIQLLRHKMLSQLSGGERQKAYLAMVLAQDAKIIVLDEPTTYMDMEYEAEFMRLLETLRTRFGKTLLVVMHDLNRATAAADHLVLLHEGKIDFSGTAAACEKSGRIEAVFHVKRSICTEDGRVRSHYYL